MYYDVYICNCANIVSCYYLKLIDKLYVCNTQFDANEEELRKKYEESEKSCRELVSVVATLRNQLVQGQEETKYVKYSYVV